MVLECAGSIAGVRTSYARLPLPAPETFGSTVTKLIESVTPFNLDFNVIPMTVRPRCFMVAPVNEFVKKSDLNIQSDSTAQPSRWRQSRDI